MSARRCPKVGEQFGARTITAVLGYADRTYCVGWRCSCGAEGVSRLSTIRYRQWCTHAPRETAVTPLRADPIGPLSHDEIAARLGITRSRVGQIEERALRKLARLAKAAGLTAEEVLG
jgi:hypothetical protein